MAIYKCPNCPITYTGNPVDFSIMAIAHAQGSHNLVITEEDVLRTIERQANPTVIYDAGISIKDWWKKINA